MSRRCVHFYQNLQSNAGRQRRGHRRAQIRLQRVTETAIWILESRQRRQYIFCISSFKVEAKTRGIQRSRSTQQKIARRIPLARIERSYLYRHLVASL